MVRNVVEGSVLEESVLRLSNRWPLPSHPRPIVIIGASDLVGDAHLPAYRRTGWPVAGVYDTGSSRGRPTAERMGVPVVFRSLDEALNQRDCVFDLAVAPEHVYDTVRRIPPESAVVIQKPLGRDLTDARQIRRVCRENRLVAAVNFQLRFSPLMLAIRDALRRDFLGDLLNVELHISLWTPWETYPYLKKMPRVELLVHSIHYLDWIRAILGQPKGVYARTWPHPGFPGLASTRSAVILNYGDTARCVLSVDHTFRFGPRHQLASVRVEGTRGMAVGTLGVMLNYPDGEPDRLEIRAEGGEWVDVPLEGDWFPDAFVGTMSNLQRYLDGEDRVLLTSVEDSYRTMALVEACYQSDATGGQPIPE